MGVMRMRLNLQRSWDVRSATVRVVNSLSILRNINALTLLSSMLQRSTCKATGTSEGEPP